MRRPPVRNRHARSAGIILAFVGAAAFSCGTVLPTGSLAGQEPGAHPTPEELERAVRERAEVADTAGLVRVRVQLGRAYDVAGRESEAIEILASALEAALVAGDSGGAASAHNAMGLLHWNRARYDSAVVRLREARDLWSAIGDAQALGRVYNNLGAAHYQWGNYEPALDAFLRSVDYRRTAGDRGGEALVLTNIGRTYHDLQQFDRARATLEEARSLAAEVDDPGAHAYALHNLGVLESTLGSYRAAIALFEASLEGYRDPRLQPSDFESGWALNALELGAALVRGGDRADGLALLEEALGRAEGREHVRHQIRALGKLGEAHRLMGDLERSVELLDRALELARDVEQRSLALEILEELALAHEARGDSERALLNLRAHSALRDSVFDQSAVQRLAAMEARAEATRRELENIVLREEQRMQDSTIARQRAVVVLGGALVVVLLALLAVLAHHARTVRERERLMLETNAALEDANHDLREALSEVRTLEGLIPICLHCKKVRDDEGFWEGVESYISSRSDALFSHSICTECGPSVYGEDWAVAGEPSGSEDG